MRPDLLHVAHLADPDDNGREDDGRNHHLDQLDEAVAERLHGGAPRRPEVPDHHPSRDGEQHLHGQASVRARLVRSRSCRWRHDVQRTGRIIDHRRQPRASSCRFPSGASLRATCGESPAWPAQGEMAQTWTNTTRLVVSCPRHRRERPPALDARLVRAHAGADDADAERGAGLARRQRRSASPGRDRRSRPRAADVVGQTVERLVRDTSPTSSACRS